MTFLAFRPFRQPTLSFAGFCPKLTVVMKTLWSFLPSLALFTANNGTAHAQSAADIQGVAPVSVSSANYRETPRDQLHQLAHGQNTLNPAPRDVAPLAHPRHFIFLPGEIYDNDLTYEEVCARLTPALATKNYINGADAQGLIREPAKVTLVLKVSYGERPWRLPTVRTEQLAWKDGMQPRTRDPRSLVNLGGDTVFENRAGGRDDALAAAAENTTNTKSAWGGGSGGRPGGGNGDTAGGVGANLAANSTAMGAISGYGETRNFHLIVIDAFDYAELKAKGKAATRLWTTIVATPKEPGKQFGDVIATLLRAAGPYWGETTSGMQVFNDNRAEVKIGEIVEVKATAPTPK